MKILFLSFYFEPDLSACSFRNSPLFKELLQQGGDNIHVNVITTQPNRYKNYTIQAPELEKGINYRIDRIKIPEHKNGFVDQALSYITYYKKVLKITKNEKYDLVYASSSRLFTCYLARKIASKNKNPLYLDIRDLFIEAIRDVGSENIIVKQSLVTVLNRVENYAFKNATHINLVSEGFKDYFGKYPKPSYSYYTNGIDDVFLDIDTALPTSKDGETKLITYAGNIGSGQALEKIIPATAKRLEGKFRFRIIGDGGVRQLLIDKIKELGVTNVELLLPVARKDLVDYYKETDYLFLHLNEFDAYKKVLPSKLFEYVAFNKPIIAGVGGYANQFIRQNLEGVILFKPTDVDSFVEKIQTFEYNIDRKKREEFISTFSRKNILQKMAQDIIQIAREYKH